MFIPFHKNFQHGSMHTRLLNAQTIGKQTGRRKQLLSHCSKYVCKAINRKWPQLLLLSVWLWGYGFVSSEAEWEIKSAVWKGIIRPFQFPLLTLTVPFSLIYFLKSCTKTCASSWTVMGLVVGKGGLGTLGATTPAEHETTALKFLFCFDQVLVCFWRTCGLSYFLSIVKSRLLPVLCLSCTEEGLFWEDIWQRNQETRL